jgi:hypothetical protein
VVKVEKFSIERSNRMSRFMGAMIVVCMLSLSNYAGVGVSLNVNINNGPAEAPPPPPPPPEQGYVAMPENDEDLYRDDMVMINRSLIGFWVTLPNGLHALHCRKILWDQKHSEWYYGSWYEDHNPALYASYRQGPFFGVHFFDFMSQHYPKYYARRLQHPREMRRVDQREKVKKTQIREPERERHEGTMEAQDPNRGRQHDEHEKSREMKNDDNPNPNREKDRDLNREYQHN